MQSDVCSHCRMLPAETGYTMPLCSRCRDTLSSRPLPMWINLVALGVGVVLIVAFVRFPRSLDAAISYERGERAEHSGNYVKAAAEYQKTVKAYPNSTHALVRLAVADYRSGKLAEAEQILGRLEGRQASKDEIAEIEQIANELGARQDRGGPGGAQP